MGLVCAKNASEKFSRLGTFKKNIVFFVNSILPLQSSIYKSQKSQFATKKSTFVKERKQISELQIISFVFILCHVEIFLNFSFFYGVDWERLPTRVSVGGAVETVVVDSRGLFMRNCFFICYGAIAV